MVGSEKGNIGPQDVAVRDSLYVDYIRDVLLWALCTFAGLQQKPPMLHANAKPIGQLPSIIEEMGFAKDANQVQLWTVIPYVVASIITGTIHIAIALCPFCSLVFYSPTHHSGCIFHFRPPTPSGRHHARYHTHRNHRICCDRQRFRRKG